MDLFLKVESYEALQSFLRQQGCEMEGHYTQCQDYLVDFIGKIPKATNPETGEVVEWSEQARFNVRLLKSGITIFDDFVSISPETPYRMFS